MPRKIADRITALEQRIEQERQLMRDLKTQEAKQARRDETRRKILYGAAWLKGLETLSVKQRAESRARVEALIVTPRDRTFLGLPPLAEPNADEDEPSDDGGQTARPVKPKSDAEDDDNVSLRLPFPEAQTDLSAPGKAASHPRAEDLGSRSRTR